MPIAWLSARTAWCHRCEGRREQHLESADDRAGEDTPVKYGLKSIKRIGTMTFTDERPPDFWAERGYDYYLGH